MPITTSLSKPDLLPSSPQRPQRAAGPRALRWGLCAAVALLAGCTQYGPVGVAAGQPMAGVVRSMGEPTQIYPMDNGARRLEFARGPIGLHTYMVDVDAGDQVTAVTQVLTEENFKTVQPGMSRDTLLRTLGRPMRDFPVPRSQESWWFYRYDNVFCRWFVVTLAEPAGTVTDTTYQPDSRCKKVRD